MIEKNIIANPFQIYLLIPTVNGVSYRAVVILYTNCIIADNTAMYCFLTQWSVKFMTITAKNYIFNKSY